MTAARKGYFVTGTDTGVGKTVLSALLVAALDALYWKPVQTGVCEGTDRESVRLCAEAPDGDLLPERYCFDPPVSPHLAAREAGVRISLNSFEFPSAPVGRTWIVEGAGGVMVPLNESDLMRDLMRHLGLPVVVAARTALGTINHTLLTLAALRDAELKVCGVVLIGAENLENRRAIEQYGNVRVVGHIPVLERIHRAALLEVFSTNFDRAAFEFTAAPDRAQTQSHA
jgi:dethiobiotin synthase